MGLTTLLRQGSSLADADRQLAILDGTELPDVPPFHATVTAHGLPPLRSGRIQVLQVNVGKLCNQTCRHCHVDAGPDRRELMSQETMQQCLAALDSSGIETVDITGGAPEMNPHFEWFVTEIRRLHRHVIDRCNLTILLAPGFTHLPEFLAENQVEVVASLPCYLEENCDRQRGNGVFRKSIEALRRLNEVGYGQPEQPLTLSLIYNPVGPSLPPDQSTLEAAYREQLRSRFGIEFNRLYTITNMPISRFLDDLLQTGNYELYMAKLVAAFNPAAVDGVMCRTTLSVDWQGNFYDCDFNQMLELPVAAGVPRHIREFDANALENRPIITGRHCYGCTAGAGSSCQGALLDGG
jgi:radical SAM/Cys-rich protein